MMTHNIKIILVLTCLVAFALNKDKTIPETNNNK